MTNFSRRMESILTLLQNLKVALSCKDTLSNLEHIEVSAQTDDIDEQCNECEYPANDIWELGEHIYEFHTIKTFGKFVCHFCDERFGGKGDLMLHRKKEHITKVSICRDFFRRKLSLCR